MGRVSLILPLAKASALSTEAVAAYRSGLEQAGYSVEVIAVLDPAEPLPEGPVSGADKWILATNPGLASAAISGLVSAAGDVLVVLDSTRGYQPDDLIRTVEPIVQGRADLVTARRQSANGYGPLGRLRIASGWAKDLARRLFGTADPFSGLVAVRPQLIDEIAGTYVPVGSRFAVDLMVRSKGRKSEVEVQASDARNRMALGLNDLRHFKRLADDRFGNLSRLLQFCAVGASGMVVDLSCYALFQLVFSRTWLATKPAPFLGSTLALAVSGALAIALALTWNFSLNRRLTFSYARFGSIYRQFVAYAMSNALGIALSFSLRLYLPARFGFFHDHKLAAAVVGIVTATGISFSLSRWVVFNHRPAVKRHGAVPPPTASEVVPTPAKSFSL